jgi:uncharacterized protein YcfJ
VRYKPAQAFPILKAIFLELESIMKKTLIAFFVLASVGGAFAQPFSDVASVRRVTPQFQQVSVTRQACETRTVATQAATSSVGGGAVLGTIVGGVIGSRFGGGDGRLAATALGAGIGAVMGNNSDRQGSPAPSYQQVQDCHPVTAYEQQRTGYLVEYDYQGRGYSAVMPNDPGATLRVNVSVSPGQ